MPYDKALRAWISSDTNKKLEKEAKKKGLTKSELTRQILDSYFERRKIDEVVDTFLKIVKDNEQIKDAFKEEIKGSLKEDFNKNFSKDLLKQEFKDELKKEIDKNFSKKK